MGCLLFEEESKVSLVEQLVLAVTNRHQSMENPRNIAKDVYKTQIILQLLPWHQYISGQASDNCPRPKSHSSGSKKRKNQRQSSASATTPPSLAFLAFFYPPPYETLNLRCLLSWVLILKHDKNHILNTILLTPSASFFYPTPLKHHCHDSAKASISLTGGPFRGINSKPFRSKTSENCRKPRPARAGALAFLVYGGLGGKGRSHRVVFQSKRGLTTPK